MSQIVASLSSSKQLQSIKVCAAWGSKIKSHIWYLQRESRILTWLQTRINSSNLKNSKGSYLICFDPPFVIDLRNAKHHEFWGLGWFNQDKSRKKSKEVNIKLNYTDNVKKWKELPRTPRNIGQCILKSRRWSNKRAMAWNLGDYGWERCAW